MVNNEIVLTKNPGYFAAKEIKWTEVRLLLPKAGTANPTVAYINNEVDWVGGGIDQMAIIPL